MLTETQISHITETGIKTRKKNTSESRHGDNGYQTTIEEVQMRFLTPNRTRSVTLRNIID
jgi:hypothetical protein